ncbi:MAG: UDP-N-acetylmuramoyl-L-alanyl-D-glutamate--2,6-diaminopimelate ligase [Ilumatobacter sp.]|uniref:UDP-N-acetylmuramoyl-L-alanyl-D-glutamate--2, 6-diaminopimelate ligase n=1 Tax=Ilumatobacter sp. TaxID=1967498 RepID=UPI00262F3326|nr:UDP-N-acetylmuramoyl-L-alanyl-D-glutamate--2,6-diaminopimelate ligase [Ilumatobacter sp.]MDJ0770215.1 UDP-N-acetylmuramoyl-L-alanyl-D-glutamate--2,6-diaminopimelate ligase [Ilumatobacter sp.]
MTTSPSALAEAVPEALRRETVDLAGAPPVVDLTHDSRQVRPGWAFACVVGDTLDGHDFAEGAVSAGASLLLVERQLALDVAQIVVTDVRAAMGHVAAAVHGEPATRLRVVGITGTNGKTTTTHLLGSILNAAGLAERRLGTLSGARTTPEAPDLQRRLAGFVREGVDAVVMEVSSHALALHRVAGTRFEVATFTNLGRDHLDLHESMEAYFRAKASLFTPELSNSGVTNADDPYGRLLLDAAAIPMRSYASDDAQDVGVSVDHHRFRWRGHDVRVPIGGRFNVMNSLAALATADALGIDPSVAVAGLADCPPVPGRFEVIGGPDDDISVVVDYAHTPDGIVELLGAARNLTGTGRVIVVFGCGGDRDADKRPLMGAAAAEHADLVFATSDNPRNEDPMAIIDAAVEGIEERYRGGLVIEPDRAAAIGAAVATARKGDVVVIAGKGHETTQTIGDVAHPFDDRVVARAALADAGRPEASP